MSRTPRDGAGSGEMNESVSDVLADIIFLDSRRWALIISSIEGFNSCSGCSDKFFFLFYKVHSFVKDYTEFQ